MKKFLAVFFSVLFALSATTVAFAGVENLTCDTCLAKLETLEAYNKHINGGCLIDFKECKYCSAKVAEANLADHEATCPKGAGECEFCGESYNSQADYAEHKATECKVTTAIGDKIPVADLVDKLVDTLKGVDWGSLLGKVVDAIKGLIGGIDLGGIVEKIKPVFEKIIEYIKGLIAQ